MFGQQLGITDDMGLQRFVFPAVSIVVNKDLNPHCDTLNPTNFNDDTTMSFSTQVPTKDCPSELYHSLKELYPNSIPICIVIYKRKCLIDYSKRCSSIHGYMYSSPMEFSGRKKLINLITSVVTHADYTGTFFNPIQRVSNESRFHFVKQSIFPNKLCLFHKSVDQMSYFSSVLHVFYLFVHKFGVTTNMVFSFVLFFAHQCNSTISLVSAMIYLMKSMLPDTPFEEDISLYSKLSNVFTMFDYNQQLKKMVSSSRHSHHQSDNLTRYTEEEVFQYIHFLNKTFAKFSSSMKNIRKQLTIERFQLFNQLKSSIIHELPGFDESRATDMILVSSLVGLLPLDYYINLPMHLFQANGQFMSREMNWNTSSGDIMMWSLSTIKCLQTHFTNKLTPNMFERATNILGRSDESQQYDIHFYFPWYNSVSNQFTAPKMQFYFRMNGLCNNDWKLEVFNGSAIVTLQSSQYSVIVYSKNPNNMIANRSHLVDNKVLNSLI